MRQESVVERTGVWSQTYAVDAVIKVTIDIVFQDQIIVAFRKVGLKQALVVGRAMKRDNGPLLREQLGDKCGFQRFHRKLLRQGFGS